MGQREHQKRSPPAVMEVMDLLLSDRHYHRRKYFMKIIIMIKINYYLIINTSRTKNDSFKKLSLNTPKTSTNIMKIVDLKFN